MQARKAMFDDLSRLTTGALGAARAAAEELQDAARTRAQRVVAEMDLVGRDEFDALKTLVAALAERQAELEARLAQMSGRSQSSEDRD